MKHLKVGIIGAGAISHEHVVGINQHPHASVVAVAELDDTRRQQFAGRYHIPRQYASAEQLIAAPDIDAVTIAIPNKFHAPITIAALQAGKHVLLEKPFARNIHEAQQVADVAQRCGMVFMLGLNNRYRRETQIIRSLVKQGLLGEIYHIKTRWMRRTGIPKLGTWFSCKELSGGGVLLDIGVHMLDLAMFLADNFNPQAVNGSVYTKFGNRKLGEGDWGQSTPVTRPFDVEDFATASIRMAGGLTISLDVSWAIHQESEANQQVELFGTDAGATIFPTARVTQYQSATSDYVISEPKTTSIDVPSCCRFANWIDAIMGTQKPLCTLEQALVVQRVLDAIYESARFGKEVAVDSSFLASCATAE